MKYKVSYRGFAYDAIYDEKECVSVEEVYEFGVCLED